MEFVQDMIQLGGEINDEPQAPVASVRLSARTFARLQMMADGMGFGDDWGVEIVLPEGYPDVAAEFVLLPHCGDPAD